MVSTPQSVALLDTRKGIALFNKLAIPVRSQPDSSLPNRPIVTSRLGTNPSPPPLRPSAQIFGSVLNMSHFLCPGSATPHYVFGPPGVFRDTSAKLGLEVLAEIPLEAEVSSRGDRGWPAVMPGQDGGVGTGTDTAGAVVGGRGRAGASACGARAAFEGLAGQVWSRLSGQKA